MITDKDLAGNSNSFLIKDLSGKNRQSFIASAGFVAMKFV